VDPAHSAGFSGWRIARLRPLTPDPLCVHPQALLAEWRVRRAASKA
jgi:hypothetical protein